MVTTLDVYMEIPWLRFEGVTSQRTAAKRLGISRNTVKKYWEGDNVPWDHKPYNHDATVMTPEVVQFMKNSSTLPTASTRSLTLVGSSLPTNPAPTTCR